MQVEQIDIGQLKPNPHNPRLNDPAVDAVARSIQTYGFNCPIVTDGELNIAAGHTRLKAAIKLGLTTVPVIRVPGLVGSKLVGFSIADNQTATLAQWDDPLLAQIIGQLNLESDFDLSTLGFPDKELTAILDSLKEDTTSQKPLIQIEENAELDEIYEVLAPNKEEKTILTGKKFIVEYSGGKDSTAALLWCLKFFPEAEIELVFIDMGADWPGYILYIERMADALKLPLVIVRSKRNIIDEFWRRQEWPSPFHPYCHDLLHDALDSSMLQHDSTEIIIVRGGRLSEATPHNIPNQTRFLKVSRKQMKDYIYFQPLYFAHKDVGQALMAKSSVPMWEGYDEGLQRTACRICPGQRIQTYAVIREKYPTVWAELMEFEGRYGPGCWSTDSDGERCSLYDMAERGDKKSIKGT
jgi:site-specific DNA-methyltransferase (adenine-specific)